jgi:hypothetical protein
MLHSRIVFFQDFCNSVAVSCPDPERDGIADITDSRSVVFQGKFFIRKAEAVDFNRAVRIGQFTLGRPRR